MGSDSSLFRVGDNIELWRVLAHLCALVLAVFAFELALHRLEHAVSRSRKFEKMVGKAYRELMVLGVVGLALKVAKESSVGAMASSMLALQIADLMIFILALALLLQATVVFLRLRKHDKHIEHAELMTTEDLVEWSARCLTAKAGKQKKTWWEKRRGRNEFGLEPAGRFDNLEEMVRLRLLRRFFLKRFGLPELFPFSKYLRQAQDNQLTHMIDVELSTWMVLLVIAWALDALATGFELSEGVHDWKSAFLATFMLFAWSLTVLHVLVWCYFKSCVHHLLAAVGHTTDEQEMHKRLVEISREETASIGCELATDALRAMEHIQELHQQQYEQKRAQRHRLLKFDTGFQLLAMCWRNISTRFLKQHDLNDGVHPALQGDVVTNADASGQIPNVQPPLIHIRWFSRKAWHLLIILLLMLNGFYLALLVQCGLHQFSLTLDDYPRPLMAAFAVVMVAPLAINAIILQPRIFRHYVIVSNVFRLDARTLGEVVSHFSEIVALRSEFVSTVSHQLQRRGQTVSCLQRAFLAHDINGSGEIELPMLRAELKALGLNISAFRFNRVIKIMFATKGMRVQYAQILCMLALSGSTDFPRLPRRSILGQCFEAEEDDGNNYETLASGPSELEQQTESEAQWQEPPRRMPRRGEQSFHGTSSRALQQLFRAGSVQDLAIEPQFGQMPYMAL